MSKKNLEFKIGEVVVYPKHGVGEIIKIENMEIADINPELNFTSTVLGQSRWSIKQSTTSV